jgi:ubiquinone/menaquinone biosynthesis C-methylase UbiE
LNTTNRPPICDYEGSDYQASFWDQGSREYEDRVEAVALRRLLPSSGDLMLEVGAGAGRNTPRYAGYRQVVLMDYSLSQVQQAQERLGRSQRYIYVAADVYRLPFTRGLFDGATMIRVLHHLSEPARALEQVRQVMKPGGVFILEYANKLNLKAIARYLLRRQNWNPFSLEAVEFAHLNFDFHPQAVRQWLEQASFSLERMLTVSHFRIGWLKRWVPTSLLVWLDSAAQLTGDWWQLTPSVFTRSAASGSFASDSSLDGSFFRCPVCDCSLPPQQGGPLVCPGCGANWPIVDGIYDFRVKEGSFGG